MAAFYWRIAIDHNAQYWQSNIPQQVVLLVLERGLLYQWV